MADSTTPAAPRNTEEQLVGPITHGGIDRGYKLCKCSVCGIVEECTPMTDFYTLTGDDKGPLLCEVCILRTNARRQP